MSQQPVPKLPRKVCFSVLVRSLALQASWNPQRMQNLGLLTALLPWLKSQPADLNSRRVFCRRYYEFFNTNPYLANFILGVLLRLESDQVRGKSYPPELAGTVRDSLGRAFASLGDQLFWLGIRPALTMGICLLGMWGRMDAVLIVVGLFALGQLWMRWVFLGRGFQLGLDIVDVLDHPHWHLGIRVTKRLGMVLTGCLAGLYLSRLGRVEAVAGNEMIWLGLGIGGGLPILLRKRLPGEGLMGVAFGLALILAFAI